MCKEHKFVKTLLPNSSFVLSCWYCGLVRTDNYDLANYIDNYGIATFLAQVRNIVLYKIKIFKTIKMQLKYAKTGVVLQELIEDLEND